MEADLGQQNIGLASAWRKAAIRDDWRSIVDTATTGINLVQNVGGRPVQGVWGTEVPQWGPGAKPR